MFCLYITKLSHLMYVFRRVILERPSKQLHTKHSRDKNWSMVCPGGATHSPKLQISLDWMTAITVGLQSRVEDVIQIMEKKSWRVFTIVIFGRGGSGKTTLAKAIYNQIHGTFTEKSFIEDIAQVRRNRAYAHLQKLLSDVLKTKVEMHSFEMGANMIRERLSGKRMLIVLDDLNEYTPFLELCACFGGGTVVIITTRNESIRNIYPVGSVFRIKLLNANESLELLSWNAFREAKPKEEYNDLAKSVAFHCGGLPLALEIIGNCLFQSTKEEWNSILCKLARIPQHHVEPKLKISFEGLRNQMEKDLFLDVCCSFVGEGRTFVKKILNGCGIYDDDSGIRVLIERGLVKVKKNNKLGMHHLLQKMGRQIIHEIDKDEMWKERQMRFDGAGYVLTNNRGTRVTDRLPVKLRSTRREPSRLQKLDGNSEYHSKKLRWISLQGFHENYQIFNEFSLHDAIAIDLDHNLLQFDWKQPQVLRWLKVLNLSHSKYLTETPDFSGLQSLEQLFLKNCQRLRKVHRSIGCLCYLILLNLKNCTSLSNLPREIYTLNSLRTLILSGCSKIDLMEKDIVRMKSLITLIAENTVVKQVPFSIVSSKAIGYISLRGFERFSCNLFPSIIIRS
ncbi:TMV resistance protein N-like isoform X2 [Vigna unguiculata]|uniref:TMV resistance protein N-like isoform X2 n=1 Tax=Vigna unguiculata TaxID=3917 RepID=UPI00101659F1|nr:TMV resistance protein N-like isoform X2 [Vigna unguiculata]